MEMLRYIVFGVPIGAWIAGPCLVMPSAVSRGGCAGWGTVAEFVCVAAIGMTACLLPAIYLAIRSSQPWDRLAVVLNLSWPVLFLAIGFW
jgi:hypothetical protein